MKKVFRACLVGFGKIAYGYEQNQKYIKEFPIPTHFRAVQECENIMLDTIIDKDISVLENVKKETQIKYTGRNIEEIPNKEEIDILIISCPPIKNKLDLIKSFPNIKGLVLEKPIGRSIAESIEIANYVKLNNISAQVAYLRRFDNFILSLCSKKIQELIGDPQSIQIIYGNGLMNNGSHMLDLVRMLFGEFQSTIKATISDINTSVLDYDLNISCVLKTKTGINVSLLPIDFNFYRENSVDIWGTKGRLAFNQEGSYFNNWDVKNSRFGDEYNEINWMKPKISGKTELGHSIKNIYSNLISSIENKSDLLSPLSSAIKTQELIDSIFQNAKK